MMALFPYRLNLNDKPFGNSTLLVAGGQAESSCRLSLPNRWQVPAAGAALKRAGATSARKVRDYRAVLGLGWYAAQKDAAPVRRGD